MAVERDVGVQVLEVPHVSGFTDLATKLIDLRGIGRPPQFSGEDAAWPEFKFRMECLGSLLGMESVMMAESIEQLRDGDLLKEKFLYSVLVQVCEGGSFAVVRQTRRGDGAMAW